jgi:hypothetical protein
MRAIRHRLQRLEGEQRQRRRPLPGLSGLLAWSATRRDPWADESNRWADLEEPSGLGSLLRGTGRTICDS